MSFYEGEHVAYVGDLVGLGIGVVTQSRPLNVRFEDGQVLENLSPSECRTMEHRWHTLPRLSEEKGKPFVIHGGHTMQPGDVVVYSLGVVRTFVIHDMKWCPVRSKWAVEFSEGAERKWKWLTTSPELFKLAEERGGDLLML